MVVFATRLSPARLLRVLASPTRTSAPSCSGHCATRTSTPSDCSRSMLSTATRGWTPRRAASGTSSTVSCVPSTSRTCSSPRWSRRAAAAGDGDPAELRTLRDDLARRLEQYRRMLAEEVRGRLRDKSHGVAGTGSGRAPPARGRGRARGIDDRASSDAPGRAAPRPEAREPREPAASSPSARPRRHAPHDPALTRRWRCADGRRPAPSSSRQARRRRALRHLRIGRRVRGFHSAAPPRAAERARGVAQLRVRRRRGGGDPRARSRRGASRPTAARHAARGDRGRWPQRLRGRVQAFPRRGEPRVRARARR